MLKRAKLVATEAQALRREHEGLSRELAAIRKDFARARGELPGVDLKLLHQLIKERDRALAERRRLAD